MKILVITESIPFPPANGKEVTISKIFERIAKKHFVDIMVVASDTQKERVKLKCLPNQIRNAFFLQATEINSTRKIFRSIWFFGGVISFYDYNLMDIKKALRGNNYDFVFLMPVKHYGLIEFCRKNNFIFFNKLILGLSDTKTHSYRDYIKEVIYPGILNWKYITFWLRSYIVFFEERDYLRKAD